MEKFSERLSALMESLEVSGYLLAREIGSSDMSISKYRAGKAMPSFEFFEKLVTRYPAVNLNWLIGKDGEMFIDPSMRPKPPKAMVHPPDLLQSKNEMIALQAKNLKMLETRVKELTRELKTYRKAGELIKAVRGRKSKAAGTGGK